MEALLALLVLGLVLWLLLGPIVAWRRAARAIRQVAALGAELEALRARIGVEPAAPVEPVVETEPEIEPEPEPAPEPLAEADPVPVAVAVATPGLEQRLTQRWLVWLGGLALALGGAFVVKAAVDQGWFGPVVRTLMAGLLGTALIVAGEWLRRRPSLRGQVASQASYVPPALAAAGASTLFATVFGAYALYDLLPSTVAFVLLALVSGLAVLLAWQHGPFLAALGFGGAFAVPALIDSGAPASWPLLAYLVAPVIGGIVVLLYKPWWWLGWLVLAGALFWSGLELIGPWHEIVPAVLFLLVATGAFAWLALRLDKRDEAALAAAARRLVLGADGLLALAMLAQALDGRDTAAALAGLLAMAALLLGQSRRIRGLEWGALIPAVVVPLALLGFAVDVVALGQDITGEAAIGLEPWHLLPEVALPFVGWCVAFGALFGLGGFAALWGARRPGLWAALAALMPLVILTLAYLRIAALTPSLPWAGLALVLGLVCLAAAARVARFRPALDGALAAFAIGVIAALSLAGCMALREAWLTVILALQLPAIGWVATRVTVPALRIVAGVVASVVLARLALGRDLGRTLNWAEPPGYFRILYGQGLPLLSFLLAARLFRRPGPPDRLVIILQTGALLFWLALLFTLVRRLIGDVDDGTLALGLAEAGLQASLWLATALGLLRRARLSHGPVERWGAAALGLGAGLMLAVIVLFDQNPLWTGEAVGGTAVVNLLFLAYAVPAILGAMLALELRRQDRTTLAGVAGIAALVLGLVYLGLELRRAFHGTYLTGDMGSAESWGYSLLLLGYAAALLVLGIWRANRPIRFASLTVLMLGVAKVFLIDLGDLEGLYRAASFIALGLCLVAIGLVYQRYVFPPKPVPG